MEKKKKVQRISSATSQEPDSNNVDLQSKEEQNQPNIMALAAQNTKPSSLSHENASSLNQQYPQFLQWQYTPQHSAEQSSLNSRPCQPTQSTQPALVRGWQQVPPLQPNATNLLVQQGQRAQQLAQSNTPFWLPQRSGYLFPGTNMPASFQPFDYSWQGPAVIEGTSSRSQLQAPNLCYHIGYPCPGFPGPWDPSSWWAHGQQSQPSCTYTFPGPYSYFPSPPPLMSNCSATIGESPQRGIIRPTAKLSQKHQQLWEAQSAENVQLWSVISQLQSEIAEFKSRLTKLEAEVLSLKPAATEDTAQVIGAALPGKASKRGRPKRSISSTDVLAIPNDSHARPRGRKPAVYKGQPKAKAVAFRKDCPNKMEDKQNPGHSTSTAQKENGEKTQNVINTNRSDLEVNGSNLSMATFHSQYNQEIPITQPCDTGTNSSLEIKSTGDRVDDSKAAVSIQPQQSGENNFNGAMATHMGVTNNGGIEWSANITPEDSGRNMFHMSSQGFYDNGNVIRQAGRLVPGWSFVNEEDASDELEDATAASAKDDNEEEMGDDASSGPEEVAQTKGEDAAQYNNW